MSRIVRPAALRRLGVVGVVLGMAVGTAAAMTPAAQAQTDPHTMSAHLPANARLYSGKVPEVGRHGALFMPQTAKTPNVVGGGPVNSSSFPGVVGIETFVPTGSPGLFDEFLCTGTVLSATEVLTAGHCDTEAPAATTRVIAGLSDLSQVGTGGTIVGVSSTWTDPTFNVTAAESGTAAPVDDVEVLRLAETLPSVYTPVTLTAQGDQSPYAAGTSATLVGYGITGAGNNDAGILREATEPIQSDATCAAAMPGYDQTRMTCAGVPAGGVGSCNGDSGGPLFVNGIEAGMTDWGPAQCAAPNTFSVYERFSTYHTAVANATNSPALDQADWTGDGHADILGRFGDGSLDNFSGSGIVSDGAGGFANPPFSLGSGWNFYSQLFRVTNWDGDNTQTLLAMTADGRLFRYDNDMTGSFVGSTGTQIGSGFGGFSSFLPVQNWSGDGLPGFIGRTSSGVLVLFEGNEAGGFNGNSGTQIGTGFNIFTQLVEAGNWLGNGNQTLLGVTSSGVLDLYQSNEAGGWTSNHAVQIGTGWNTFSKVFTVGDWSGDELVDLLGINGSGQLFLYVTDGHGNFLTSNGTQIGQGWNALNAVF